jgi:hypothetical protein
VSTIGPLFELDKSLVNTTAHKTCYILKREKKRGGEKSRQEKRMVKKGILMDGDFTKNLELVWVQSEDGSSEGLSNIHATLLF